MVVGSSRVSLSVPCSRVRGSTFAFKLRLECGVPKVCEPEISIAAGIGRKRQTQQNPQHLELSQLLRARVKGAEHPKLLEEFLRETLPLEKFCNAELENFESHCQTLGGSRHLSKCFNSASMLLQLPDMFHHVPFHLNQSSQSCRCHHVPYDTCLVHILHLKTATGCCGFQSTQSNQSTLHRPVGESHGR